ncbi:MAG: magnesium/cobalt transporter CorA [Planctomycetota bacterium]
MLNRIFHSRAHKVGLPPGTLLPAEEPSATPARMTLIDYDARGQEVRELAHSDQLAVLRESPKVSWIDLTGLHDIELLRRIGTAFAIHPLVLEDIVNTDQRPKIEAYDDGLFAVLKMLAVDPATGALGVEQVSLYCTAGAVITFQERPGDVFDPLRERIATARGRIRRSGTDYLAYAIIDIIVDHYFVVLERFGEEIEALEQAIIKSRDEDHAVTRIHELKRRLLFVRRSTWPLREAVAILARDGHPLLGADTAPYLRDLADHCVQVIDNVEILRDMVGGLLDLHLSATSNRMNEVMQVLTLIATIFIPLTFIAGVYGMNFDHMPELHWAWGYPAVLGLCALLAVTMVVIFKRRGWL